MITRWDAKGGLLTRRGRTPLIPPTAKAAGRLERAELTTSGNNARLIRAEMTAVTVAAGQVLRAEASAAVSTYPNSVKLSSFAQPGDTLRAALNRLSADAVVDLEGGTYSDPDFSMGGSAYTYFFGPLIGLVNGSVTITPNSSTHVAAVNAQVAAGTGTVAETILRIGRGSSKATTQYISDLVVDGTSAEGHIYNGINIYYGTNASVNNLTVLGVPGSGSAPPSETFPIDNYQSSRTTFTGCMVDGSSGGSNIAASGLGNNSAPYVLGIGSTFKNMRYGAGVTHYLCASPTYIGCTFRDNHSAGANFEKTTGTITMVNCTFINNAHPMTVDTDGPSAVVNIYDPIWVTKYGSTGMPGTFDILRHDTYAYPPGNPSPPNQELVSDFHIFMGGTWVGGRPEDGGHYVGGSEVTSTYLKVVSG